mmetsp:Transcript_25257/g.44893  ORF Transcript_25257/g.44893 Transcript_25257/m.44893 type:complete len:206 (+) Transcript_25257:2331-2948(+)
MSIGGGLGLPFETFSLDAAAFSFSLSTFLGYFLGGRPTAQSPQYHSFSGKSDSLRLRQCRWKARRQGPSQQRRSPPVSHIVHSSSLRSGTASGGRPSNSVAFCSSRVTRARLGFLKSSPHKKSGLIFFFRTLLPSFGGCCCCCCCCVCACSCCACGVELEAASGLLLVLRGLGDWYFAALLSSSFDLTYFRHSSVVTCRPLCILW